MKGFLVVAGVLYATIVALTEAFICSPTLKCYVSRRSALNEKKVKVEQEVTDLNLEDMFEVFEKADKSVSDKEVGKKNESKGAGKDFKDMLGSFFGGEKKDK